MSDYTPECDCLCLTNDEHAALWPDLQPRGDDLPQHHPFGRPGGDAMTVTFGGTP